MAGLIEELITTLEEESRTYKELLLLATEKTEVIVKDDVPGLQAITEKEQDVAGQISRLDKRREQLINDIGLVINRDPKELTISMLIKLLDNQQKEQTSLISLFNDIKLTLDEFENKNEQNKILLNHSMEFLNFTVNALQSSRQAPETANYSKGNTFNKSIEQGSSMFDAKQ